MKVVVNDQDVQVNGTPVQVYFNYGETDVELLNGPATVRSVECIIRPFPENKDVETEPISTGIAMCSPLDNFNRSKGRFLAWKRAVGNPDDSPFTRDQRAQLWTWFTNTCTLPSDRSF